MEERLVRCVIPVLPSGEASRCHRGDEPLLRLYVAEGGSEVREIGGQRLPADIGDRAGEHRRPAAERARRAKARCIELAVELAEFQPIPPPGERRQTAWLARLPAAQPPPGIARPGAVIDPPRGCLAVFAVVDDIDADLGLLMANLLHRGCQRRRMGRRVVGLAGKLGAVELDQGVGPRQAPDMRGEYPSVAWFHDSAPAIAPAALEHIAR